MNVALGRTRPLPGLLYCCSCARGLETVRSADSASAGAGILPHVPGAVCQACLSLVEGPAVTDLKAAAAAQMLQSLDFEVRPEHAAQFFLDLFGWNAEVVASGAMRLHADGKSGLAYRFLQAALEATGLRWFMVEEATLRMLDGETGRAHDLLLATGPEDHPCWHLHRGTLAYSVGRPDAALEFWRQQVEARPDQLLGWQTLGFYLLHEKGEPQAAVRHFEQAGRHFPGHPEFLNLLEEAREHLSREEST